MKNSKKAVLIIFLILLVVSTVFYFLHDQATKNVREAGVLVLDRDSDPKLALEKLELAQKQWQLFYYDELFQAQLKYAREVINRPGLVIYLKDDATEADGTKLMEEIRNVNGVKDIKFISKAQGDQRYKETYKNSPALLELFRPNMLPQMIEVYLNDYSTRGQIIEKAREESFVLEAI